MDKQFQELIDLMTQSHIDFNLKKVEEAFYFAKTKHDGQLRMSKEPYFNHVFETAKILAENKFPEDIVISGLLHDTLEDTDTTNEEIRKKFGKNVEYIVDGVTKLGKIKYRGKERYAENLRKMLTRAASNAGVLYVKFADRIHNLRTLQYHNRPEKIERIARESLDIYAKIANRLNVGNIQAQLEDLSFKFLYPEEYKKIEKILQQEQAKNSKYVDGIIKKISKLLYENNIKNFNVSGRVKHIYSLYKKLQKKDFDMSQIYDIQAVRILVDDETDCYRVLGVIHKNYKPMPGRIKDYIANPKPNGYQSIHTTIFCDKNKITEVQIRTYEMHNINEYGVSSHSGYKDKKMSLEWLKDLETLHKEAKDEDDFIESLKLDLFQNRIFVLTPNGDAIDLPDGATPVDFAYHVHSSIGNRCYQAKINGKIATLDCHLKNGDVVEIITKKNEEPQKNWLMFVRTSNARSSIKKWLKNKID
ncbi:MAG: RelA/SpoT family protein [Patescibacteria group bacterium]